MSNQDTMDTTWDAPHPAQPVDGTVIVPASKSLTNRYLLLAALADGPSRISNALASRDSDLMIAALRALGTGIESVDSPDGTVQLRITPMDLEAQMGQVDIDCGLAGTVMRFVPPLAALARGSFTFDGDPHARLRPMAPVLTALSDLGVQVTGHGEPGLLPATVNGTGSLAGGRIEIDASGSSQFISALMLVAPRTTHGVEIVAAEGRIASPDHIEMTVQTLRELGVVITRPDERSWRVEPGRIRAFERTMEPDLSNAGPFLAAAMVTGGTVRIPHWPSTTTQVGDQWRTILTRMGARITHHQDGTLQLTGPAEISGIDYADSSELAPTLAAICALATGTSRLTGIAHLRGHETDRLAALATEINNLGGRVTELEDGLLIEPAPLHGGSFATYADHRMATAGAIIGLAVPGVEVVDIATTAKTMPDFPTLWTTLAASGKASR
ncbi:3-phosphoshikimate 1-carboxyvinyltransferase [Paeniglutamicibacter sulfureus]|uniref:3-phosphoshikimate 1-carboxyvinyltransferase n=1 Tax=Paeniglutamicibacter sulfureus TaxID=43666 RepID=A0ABU2BNC7_9MICC|nr:3-phosphoshikimate 1-carboxyvinyltransferase [Paeniglutamicibacter sulfureus]MDO2935766.1 3-phosphoshikimate 1-carboxyvinyltransferase [Paeniglutamicibacter sulfureus]MDR7360155.1 3-phosphoshikimate 1-carboxyvinyltransferase [Paeniglutamicibacter sulfureus]